MYISFLYIVNSMDAYLGPLIIKFFLPDNCHIKTVQNQWSQISNHAIIYIYKN